MPSLEGAARYPIMKRWLFAPAACAALIAASATAEIRQSAPDDFTIEHRYTLTATPDRAWQALVHPELWWPSEHTWSGAASNLSLAPEAGGCFCERWADGSAEHGRVVISRTARLLRIRGALGPMQEMAVTGVLTIALEASGSGTAATVTYRVSGDSSHGLDKLAPVVNDVLNLQFGNFAAYASKTSGQ